MIKKIIEKWDKNKGNLEKYFRENEQSCYDSYKKILELIIELVLNYGEENDCKKYDSTRVSEIDDGNYQGTLIYLIPLDTWQPDITDYLYTYVWYGSCSGCDTLLSISGYEDGLPNEEQVKDYMELSLHMIQNMKYLWERE